MYPIFDAPRHKPLDTLPKEDILALGNLYSHLEFKNEGKKYKIWHIKYNNPYNNIICTIVLYFKPYFFSSLQMRKNYGHPRKT